MTELYSFWNGIFFIFCQRDGAAEFNENLIVYLNNLWAEDHSPIEGCDCGQYDCLECMPF